MNLIDEVITNPLVGIYCGITFLVLVNILVALLAGSVMRIYDHAVVYTVFQRAVDILNDEKSFSNDDRIFHIEYLQSKSCNPSLAKKAQDLTEGSEKIEDMQKMLKEQNEAIERMVTF